MPSSPSTCTSTQQELRELMARPVGFENRGGQRSSTPCAMFKNEIQTVGVGIAIGQSLHALVSRSPRQKIHASHTLQVTNTTGPQEGFLFVSGLWSSFLFLVV